MTAATEQLPMESATVNPRTGSLLPLWGAAVIVALGHAPLLIDHFCNLWIRPHYQFFVFLPIGIWLLAARSVREYREEKGCNSILIGSRSFNWMPLFIAGTGLLASATYLHSPWLAMISALVCTMGFSLLACGIGLTRRLIPAWLLMWLAVPLPGNLDLRLIESLRTVTTEWASAVLDQFGVLHLINGNVIELPGISLFIADACTGIHSLFVLLAVALFLGLWLRRSIVHIGLLIISTIGIVLVENIVRVAGVAMAYHLGIDLTEGWRHSVLGFVLFALSVGLIYSTDSLLRFLLPTREWFAGFHWFRRLSGRKTSQHADWERVGADQTPSNVEDSSAGKVDLSRFLSVYAIPFYVAFLMLAVMQLIWMPSRASQLTQMLKRSPIDIPELGADALPEQFKGWTRRDYVTESRVRDDPMGENSQTWVYQKDGFDVSVSLDYPYRRMHDLTSCYAGVGWTMEERNVFRSKANPAEDDVTRTPDEYGETDPFVAASMKKRLHGYAVLIYSLYNTEGQCEVELKDDMSLEQVFQRRIDFDVPWFQIQILATDASPIEEDRQEQLRELFFQMRRLLRDRCMRELNGTGREET